MELKIKYSRIAFRDLKDIYQFISRDSVRYAKKEIDDIRYAIKKLRLHPYRGKVFEYSDNEFTRELAFKNYRVIYDIADNKTIIILTIHHHSRSLGRNPAIDI